MKKTQAQEAELEPRPTIKGPNLLRGMKDILPSDQPYWNKVRDVVREISNQYRYERIDTPILEDTRLFIRTIGKDTDVVEKEMYEFVDRSGQNIVLRPEMSAPVVRAYIEHGLLSLPQPVKLYYFGPMFRYDRPQAGRYRQHYQFGFEVLGAVHPVIDAQLITIANHLYTRLGIPINVHINSIGDKESRGVYEKALTDYYKSRKNSLCDDCKRRLQKNPLRLLDCKQPDCKELSVDAPQTVDYLNEESRQHFVSVLEYLDEQEIAYTLNPKIVRGLDYYTRTTFEIFPDQESDGQSCQALGGGGRYDDLIEELCGRPTPGVGFACGVERLVAKLKEQEADLPGLPAPDVFLGQLGDPARKLCLKLFDELQAQGIGVAESLSKDGIKAQLEVADRLGAKFALIIGQKEMMDGTILVRDMENGIQEVVDFKRAVPEILKRLTRGKPSGINKPAEQPDKEEDVSG
ncbi:MAG: histidine--tRNA ligase [bacterium]